MNFEVIKIIPEYISAILSWPVVAFVISLVLLHKFSEEISIFLRNTRFFKAGPIELQSQFQTETEAKTKKTSKKINQSIAKKGITLTDQQIQQLEGEFSNLLQETSTKDEQIKNKDQLIEYLAVRSELYEFMYFNLFLVQNTKLVLLWFNGQSATKDYFNLLFQNTITNPIEREAIFNALLNNQLIEVGTGNFRVTDKGIRYLKFIGLVK